MDFDINKILSLIPFLNIEEEDEEDDVPSVLAGFSLDEDEIDGVEVDEDEIVDPEELAAIEAENKRQRKKKILIAGGIVLAIGAAIGMFMYLQKLRSAPVDPLQKMTVLSAIPETITLLPTDERLTVLTGEASEITEKFTEEIREDERKAEEKLKAEAEAKAQAEEAERLAVLAEQQGLRDDEKAALPEDAAFASQNDKTSENVDSAESSEKALASAIEDEKVDPETAEMIAAMDAAFSQSAEMDDAVLDEPFDTDDILADIERELDEIEELTTAVDEAEQAVLAEEAETLAAAEKAVEATAPQPPVVPKANRLEAFEPELPKLRLPDIPTMTHVENFLTSVATLGYLKPNEDIAPLSYLTPLEELQREVKEGFVIPTIGKEGQKPWWIYRKKFDAPGYKYRIAVVITGLGMRRDIMDAAILSLPSAVTLSFSPYTPNLAEVITRAREAGHETLIDLPLEPDLFPRSDPGPLSQTSVVPTDENRMRLLKILSTNVAFNGLVGTFGGSYARNPDNMRPVLQELKKAGLLYVDNMGGEGVLPNSDLGVAMKVADVRVGHPHMYDDAIRAQFDFLEKIAVYRGNALAILQPKPVTFKHLYDWNTRINEPPVKQVEKEKNIIPVVDQFVIAPVSAVVTE